MRRNPQPGAVFHQLLQAAGTRHSVADGNCVFPPITGPTGQRAPNTYQADQGSNTILPPSPPRSMRAWTSLAAESGSRSITTG